MAKVKYKVGDKVRFNFIGQKQEGKIETISEGRVNFSRYNTKYSIRSGEHLYPISYEGIESKIR
tara:strand:+ start:795 stop:986 length:192 start_codon:yes stop_codon:yes gene_type:complete